MNYNKVILLGNLTRDPEVRVTPKGTSICQFGLAVNRDYKTEGGEKQSEVTFVDIEAWGKQAETVARYCVKGRPLLIEGRLKFDQWEDKATNQKRSKLKVVLESFQFIGSKQDAPRVAPAGLNPSEDRDVEPAQITPEGKADLDKASEDVPF